VRPNHELFSDTVVVLVYSCSYLHTYFSLSVVLSQSLAEGYPAYLSRLWYTYFDR